ncbi:sialin-like [Oscarella lobularis]|uniref:sialin-like n=1 Tax=Oscarella lobularis TaxID=121494 RepID=UPI00331331E5
MRSPPARYVLALLAFFGLANVYALRFNLSVAISELKWSSNTKGVVLASFFYGYALTNIPGGFLARKYGGKHVFGIGCLCTTILTLFTPLAAYQSPWLLVAIRIGEGIGEGVSYPALIVMLSHWVPPLERTILSNIAFSGAMFGTVVAMPISGLLCQHGFPSPPHGSKWPSVFYVFGCLGLVWWVTWLFFAFNSPAKHPRIDISERIHIETKIAEEMAEQKIFKGSDTRIPIREIFTSWPVWAIFINSFCGMFGYYALLTCLPSFFNDVLNFNITDDGFLSALPYGLMVVVIVFSSWLVDICRRKSIMSTTAIRKLAQVLATYTSSKTIATVHLCLGVSLGGVTLSGAGINYLDIAPRYSGIILASGKLQWWAAGGERKASERLLVDDESSINTVS